MIGHTNLNTLFIITCELQSTAKLRDIFYFIGHKGVLKLFWKYTFLSIQNHQIENVFVTLSRWRHPLPAHLLMLLRWEDMQCGSSKLPPSFERVSKLSTQVQNETSLQAIVCLALPIGGNGK